MFRTVALWREGLPVSLSGRVAADKVVIRYPFAVQRGDSKSLREKVALFDEKYRPPLVEAIEVAWARL